MVLSHRILLTKRCGHCKNLAPEFKKAATKLKGLVKVVSIDCDEDKNKSLCSRYGIKGFPTLKIFPSDKKKPVLDYEFKRDAATFVETTVEKIASFVKSVDDKGLVAYIASEMPKVMLFSDKKVIPPLFKALSVEYEGRIMFGMVDRGLMKQFGVEKFPSVVLVKGGDATEYVAYDGLMKYAGLNAFLKELVGDGKAAPVKIDKKVHELKTQLDLDSRCLTPKKTCLVAFYNFFSADSPANLPDFTAFIKMLESRNADPDYTIVWVNAAVSGDVLMRTLGVSDALPGMAVINSSRVLGGEVDAKGVDAFIADIKGGRGRVMKLPDVVKFGRGFTEEL